jgi:DNA-binding winged helix-turn-helix (wHTH) protein/tetratricopeptide (TPR) repeat protein
MSDSSLRLRFADFELDESNALLKRGGMPIALPPKAFALLCELARQPGRLADKNALLDAVWGHRFVSESVLKTTVSQVRAALADDAGEPRFIETVSRRGYRFIGEHASAVLPEPTRPATTEHARTAAEPDAAPAPALPPMIGRVRALEQLHAGWQRATAGQRQLFWVAGEAGVGKTTLIDRFVAEIGADFAANGQCVEQFGAVEPYLPIFDALKVLCRRDPEIVPLLRRAAPTWLVQMPWLVAEADRAALHLELAGAGQERMVRELIELGALYAQRAPLLLITEDLHWADDATLRLMEHFARRRPEIHIMWIATFRLTQVIAEDHPLKALRQELQLHRLAEEILLDPFSEQEVGEYVRTRLPGTELPEETVRRLHVHTDGLPLFVANVLDGLLAQEADGKGGASVREMLRGSGGRALPIPTNLAGAIEKQLTKLTSDVRGMLEAASVCGMEFSARRVARLLEHDKDEVTEKLDELVRRRYWLSDAGVVDLPDGTIDTRYVFRHALYKHVLYQRIPTTRRVVYHRYIARAIGRSAGMPGEVTAAELASHFELGREYAAAVAQYVEAAKSALSRFAPRETIDLTGHALTLLPKCPEGPERLELELGLLAHRGLASAQILGVSSPESVAAFNRVKEICDSLPETPARALLLNGLGWGYYTRGEFAEAIAMSERVHALALRTNDPTLLVYACSLLGVTYGSQGKRALARQWFEKGLAACAQHGDRAERPLFLLDPEVAMRTNFSPALVLLGCADQAREQLRKAEERANRIGQPIAVMLVHWVASLCGIIMGDVDTVAEHQAKLAAIVETASLRQGFGPACWYRGWLEIRRGDFESAYAHIMQGYGSHASLGMFSGLPVVLGHAAEALLCLNRHDEAETKIDEALAIVERLQERGAYPLLMILKSRIVARRGDVEVRRCLDAALADTTVVEPAPGAELLVRTAIAGLPSCTAADLEALAAAYERVTEGRSSPAAAAARAVLAQPRGKPPGAEAKSKTVRKR